LRILELVNEICPIRTHLSARVILARAWYLRNPSDVHVIKALLCLAFRTITHLGATRTPKGREDRFLIGNIDCLHLVVGTGSRILLRGVVEYYKIILCQHILDWKEVLDFIVMPFLEVIAKCAISGTL
jgi:hypothetical protein